MIKKIIITIGVLFFIGVIINLLLDLNKLEKNINLDNQGELYLENNHVKISKVSWGVSSNHTEIHVLQKENNFMMKFNNSIFVKEDKSKTMIYSEKIPENYITNSNEHLMLIKINDQGLPEIEELSKKNGVIKIVY